MGLHFSRRCCLEERRRVCLTGGLAHAATFHTNDAAFAELPDLLAQGAQTAAPLFHAKLRVSLCKG